jgi:membrane protease YdiL (CAAX protease family)
MRRTVSRLELSRNQQAAMFVVATITLTALFQYPLFGQEPLGNRGSRFIFAMMWCPAIAAVLVSLVIARPFAAMGWRIPAVRYLVLGIAIPVAYTAITYLLAWRTGAGERNPEFSWNVGGLVFAWFSGCVFALGEEIGWRGFLTPLLARTLSFTKVAMIVGVIWAVWHFPPILRGDYGSGESVTFSLTCFTLMLLGMNLAITWLRLASGSIWPAVLMHGTHNVVIQSVWSPLTNDTQLTSKVVGEFGVGLASLAVLAGSIALLLIARRSMRNDARGSRDSLVAAS